MSEEKKDVASRLLIDQKKGTFCVEVELVRQVHTLFVRSAQVKVVVFELQVREEVEGVRQEVREVKGESKVEESRSPS